MSKWFKLLIILAIAINGNSQKVIDVDKQTGSATVFNYMYTVAGVPFVNARFARVVEGSPFFNEKPMKGAIILSEGKEYKNMMVRINLLETQVNYLDDKQVELVASTPVKEVVLWDTINGKDHRFVYYSYIGANEKIEKSFYELLQTGTAEFYKQYKKLLSESKPYGSATEEQRIHTQTNYYLLKTGRWEKIKKLKDLLEVLNDKSAEIKDFIANNKVSGDNQDNFEKVVGFYNSLFTK